MLASFGLLTCTPAAIFAAVDDAPVAFTVFFALAAAIALVDIVVIVRRKRRGEPG